MGLDAFLSIIGYMSALRTSKTEAEAGEDLHRGLDARGLV